LFEEIDSNEQGAAATSRQGIIRSRACSEGIVKKEGSLYLYTSPIDFFQSSLASCVPSRVQLLDTEDDQPTVHEEGPSPLNVNWW